MREQSARRCVYKVDIMQSETCLGIMKRVIAGVATSDRHINNKKTGRTSPPAMERHRRMHIVDGLLVLSGFDSTWRSDDTLLSHLSPACGGSIGRRLIRPGRATPPATHESL